MTHIAQRIAIEVTRAKEENLSAITIKVRRSEERELLEICQSGSLRADRIVHNKKVAFSTALEDYSLPISLAEINKVTVKFEAAQSLSVADKIKAIGKQMYEINKLYREIKDEGGEGVKLIILEGEAKYEVQGLYLGISMNINALKSL